RLHDIHAYCQSREDELGPSVTGGVVHEKAQRREVHPYGNGLRGNAPARSRKEVGAERRRQASENTGQRREFHLPETEPAAEPQNKQCVGVKPFGKTQRAGEPAQTTGETGRRSWALTP